MQDFCFRPRFTGEVSGEQHVKAGMQILDAFAVFEQQRAGITHGAFGDAALLLFAAPVDGLAGVVPTPGVFRRGLPHFFQFFPGADDFVQDRIVCKADGKGVLRAANFGGVRFLVQQARQFVGVGEFDAADETLRFVARALQGNRAFCLRVCHDGVIGFFVL